jgi:hypothetical protein
MGSLGNVLAAAFCPRMLGHHCCLGKTSGEPPAQSHQHIHGMAMVGMTDESMSMEDDDMQGMVMDDADVSTRSSIDSFQLPNSEELVATDKIESPTKSCTHCMSHSGVPNAPITSVSMADQSNKDSVAVPLMVSRFLVRPAMTLARIGLPREHAPPGTTAPRYILISVFLI